MPRKKLHWAFRVGESFDIDGITVTIYRRDGNYIRLLIQAPQETYVKINKIRAVNSKAD